MPQLKTCSTDDTAVAGIGIVHFIGAGPGDPELLTLKAQRLIREADLILHAGSLVNPAILEYAKPEALQHSSTRMPLAEQVALMRRVAERGGSVARLHTGDPSIFGAIFEQMRALDEIGIAYDVVPGVSSAMAAAAALTIELTIPDITQTVVFSRVSGRTPVPPPEELSALASLRCSLVLFLSAGMLVRIGEELLKAGYDTNTPVAVVYRASWPDQLIVRGTLADIAQQAERAEITNQAIIIVSPALRPDVRASAKTSHLYGTALEPPTQQGNVAIVTLTRPGTEVGLRLVDRMDDARLYAPRRFLETSSPCERSESFDVSIRQVLQSAFTEYRALVCIMASGIVVRELAPLLRNKHSDPAVVVVDTAGRYAVSLLSGHKGGANGLACRVARILGGQAVLTTASDAQHLPALDLIGDPEGWVLGGGSDLTAVTATLVNGDAVGVVQESGGEQWWPQPQPQNLTRYASSETLVAAKPEAAVFITHRLIPVGTLQAVPSVVVYHPRVLTVGVGCNRGTSASEIENAIEMTLHDAGLATESIACLATIDAKADEEGLLTVCAKRNWPLQIFSHQEISSIENLPNPSVWAERALGVRGVCEPAAALAASVREWLVEKKKQGNVTVAVCLRQDNSIEGEPADHE